MVLVIYLNSATKVLLRRNFSACTVNVQQSLKVPCVLYTCTLNLPLTRHQKSTCAL